jgi:hypothetical protein
VKTVLLIDPPEGSKYGFPKIIPVHIKPEDVEDWIVSEGYPRSLIGQYGKLFYCKIWNEEIADE